MTFGGQGLLKGLLNIDCIKEVDVASGAEK